MSIWAASRLPRASASTSASKVPLSRASSSADRWASRIASRYRFAVSNPSRVRSSGCDEYERGGDPQPRADQRRGGDHHQRRDDHHEQFGHRPRLSATRIDSLTSARAAGSRCWQADGMERVLGIGGYFVRAADPAALGAWYRDCLGLDGDDDGVWQQEAGPTVFAPFESGTDYFGSRTQQTMLNFRVRDLDAMLAQLRSKGADVTEEPQEMEGIGRFCWVTDPEGNRIELWQPASPEE
jgi:predicted enzyme related to lactoylglutathione lyase